jgi:hypothetical protein
MPLGVHQQMRKSKLEFNTEPCYTNVHVPVILTTMDYKGRCPDDSVGPWKIWYPMRERMWLSFDGHPEPGTLEYHHEPQYDEYCEVECPPPRKPGDHPCPLLTDIAAVPDMREIFPERSSLRRKALRRKPPHYVAAQVFVPKGCVSSDGPYDTGVPVEYLPPRTDNAVRKCAQPHVIVTVEAEKLDIAMYSLDTGERLDGLSFKVTSQCSEILIGNGDPKHIRKMVENPDSQQHIVGPFADELFDRDFELHYNILGGFDDGGPLPIPHYPRRFGLRPCYTSLVNGG